MAQPAPNEKSWFHFPTPAVTSKDRDQPDRDPLRSPLVRYSRTGAPTTLRPVGLSAHL